jgi:putative hydrolase of HD superfamily
MIKKRYIKRDIELLFEVGCLRFVQRSWRQFLNADFANLAEHHLRVIWVSIIIAKHEGIKGMEKVLKMALIHDLAESRTGDVNYLQRQYIRRFEEMGIKDMLEKTIIEREFIELWKEYEKQESLEAKVVKDADNLDVDFEIKEQNERGMSVGGEWIKKRKSLVYKQLNTKTAKRLWKEIYTANPHDWHYKGRNRFNNGDWSK